MAVPAAVSPKGRARRPAGTMIKANPRDDGSSIVKKTICAILLLIFWGSTYSALQAQEMADTLKHSSVTAFAARSVTPVHTLSGETLQKLSSNSIADALRYFSGVQIKDYGGIGGLKTVNVRSLGAQHVGVFYDGIRITNAQNGQVDLGRYSLDNMEAVSLYNAQKSETLQSAAEYASGSSVYLRTKTPVFDGKPFNIMARVKAGSFGSINPTIRYERKLRNLSLSAEGMYLRSEGDYKFNLKSEYEDTTGRRSNGDIRAARAELGLWAKPFEGDLQAHIYYYDSERGLPGPVVRRLSDQYSAKDRQWDRNVFLQSSYRKTLSKWAFLINAKGSYDYLEYLSDPAENAAAAYTHNTYHQKDFYGSGTVAWYPLDWISFNLAFDERWSDLICDVKYFNYVQRFDTKAAAAVSIAYEGFSLQSSLLFTHVQDVTKGQADPLVKLTPTVITGWRNEQGTMVLRAFYKGIFRAPTLNDLYYVLVGNARLQPEYARQWDLGFDLQSPAPWRIQTKFSVDAYLNRVTDKIVAMPVRSQFRWTMMNFGKVHGTGINASLSGSTAFGRTKVNAMLSYSYEDAVDLTDPTAIDYGGQIPYTPWNSGSMILGIDHDHWSANLSVLYTGKRYRSSDNIAENLLDPWMTADLSLSREFAVRGYDFNLGIDVNNILNQQYEVVTRYPMPGINYMLKLTIRI